MLQTKLLNISLKEVSLAVLFFLSLCCQHITIIIKDTNNIDSLLKIYLSSQINYLDSFEVKVEGNLKGNYLDDYNSRIKLLNSNFNINEFDYIDSINIIKLDLKHKLDKYKYSFSFLQLYCHDTTRLKSIFKVIKNDIINNPFRFYHRTNYNDNKTNTRYEPLIFKNSIILFEYGLYMESPEAKILIFVFLKSLDTQR